jgi:hypothetical protein
MLQSSHAAAWESGELRERIDDEVSSVRDSHASGHLVDGLWKASSKIHTSDRITNTFT